MGSSFTGSSSVIIGGFYRPPDAAEPCLLQLKSFVSSLPPNASMFLCEDLNVPNMFWETLAPTCSDKNSILLCSILQDFALEQCVRIPTRGLNILDLLLINSPFLVSDVDVVDNLIMIALFFPWAFYHLS